MSMLSCISSFFDTSISRLQRVMRGMEPRSRLGIRILSSVGYEEHKFNRNSSIFVADAKTYRHRPAIIYHIPGTTLFKDYVNGSWIKNPLDKVLDAVSVNVGKYGYAV